MSEIAEVLPNMDISDQQVEQFFNSGGELPAEQEVAIEPAVEAEPQQQEVKEEPQVVSEDVVKEKVEKVVPYGALHEERERRKELARALQEQQDKTRKLEETFQKVLERVNSQQAPNVPNYEEDPTEALKAKTEQLEKTLQTHNMTLAQQQQMAEQQRHYQEFVNRYQESARAYLQEQPDFQNAYQHLVSSRIQEYQAAGYSYQEANNMVVQDELAIASKAYQDGVNPGERIYALAKARGYNHQPAQQEPPKPQKNEAAAKLEQLEKGLNAATSLSNASGKASGELTLEALAQMSEDDPNFDKAWEKLIKGAK